MKEECLTGTCYDQKISTTRKTRSDLVEEEDGLELRRTGRS